MRFCVDVTGGNWPCFKKPRILWWLNSHVRLDVSSYPNYFRFMWAHVDFTVQWGGRLKVKKEAA